MSDGMDNMGSLNWELSGCLLLAWVLVCLCLSRGIQSSGKVTHIIIVLHHTCHCVRYQVRIVLLQRYCVSWLCEIRKIYIMFQISFWNRLFLYSIFYLFLLFNLIISKAFFALISWSKTVTSCSETPQACAILLIRYSLQIVYGRSLICLF